jgi:arylsulfatase A-like enzyme
MHGVGEARFSYPSDDATPRFPQILSDHGVTTVALCSVNFLANDFGVARGFREDRVIPVGRNHAFAQQMIEPLLDRLRRAGNGPLFLYTHLMEPHAPYDRGKVQKGPLHDRYLSEITVADEQIRRVAQLLAQKFADRGVLIISADHGEAFGEHGTWEHTKTLYQELLHVPLLVRGPGIVPRAIDQRVGLVDLGPTILDLFGIGAPGYWEGQSLVPLLAGRDVTLDRPLAAEGRLRHALFFGESLKAIDDPRRKVVEVYDLARDPGETVNLFDTDRAAAEPALAALRAFFTAHTIKKPGYSPVYKP